MIRSVLIPDASRYQPVIKCEEMPLCPGMILKSGADSRDDPSFVIHAAEVIGDGKILMNYHWNDPIGSDQTELAYLKTVYARYKPKYMWLDCEQWWSNWGTWSQAIAKKIQFSAVSMLTPKRISDSAYALWSSLNDAGIPCGIYTSQWFVRSYAKDMAKWIGRANLWVAHYGNQPKVRTPITWGGLIMNWLPNYPVLLPDGADPEKVVGHQFTGDRFLLPGMYADTKGTILSPADVSVFNKEFIDGLSSPSTTPTPVPPQYTHDQKVDLMWAKYEKEVKK